MKITFGVITFALLITCSVAFCQKSDLSTPLLALTSSDWQKRSDAYQGLASNAGDLKRTDVRTALFDLLDRENHTLRAPSTDNESYAESYGEYVSRLAGTDAEIADWSDAHQICILAHSPYDPFSQFASDLVVKARALAIPCLLKMSEGSFGDRYQSIPELLHLAMLAIDVPASAQKQIERVTVSGVHDPNTIVRQTTIEAIGEYGKEDMIPTLQQVASSDPVSRRLDNGQLFFTVRVAAEKAIQSIEQRAEKH